MKNKNHRSILSPRSSNLCSRPCLWRCIAGDLLYRVDYLCPYGKDGICATLSWRPRHNRVMKVHYESVCMTCHPYSTSRFPGFKDTIFLWRPSAVPVPSLLGAGILMWWLWQRKHSPGKAWKPIGRWWIRKDDDEIPTWRTLLSAAHGGRVSS